MDCEKSGVVDDKHLKLDNSMSSNIRGLLSFVSL